MVKDGLIQRDDVKNLADVVNEMSRHEKIKMKFSWFPLKECQSRMWHGPMNAIMQPWRKESAPC